jgi:hypothetical protein
MQEHRNAKRWPQWAVFFILGVIAVSFAGNKIKSIAWAQTPQANNSAGNVVVVPVQLGRDSYGIAMVDQLEQRIWVYELSSRSGTHNRLRLLAARNFKYDRLLDDYNTGEPKPEQVKKILEKLSMPGRSKQEKQYTEELEDAAEIR